MSKVHIEVQKLTKEKHGRPHKSEFKKWFEALLQMLAADQRWSSSVPKIEPLAMTVRIVDEAESTRLNTYARNIGKPTNVLSFPFDSPHSDLDNYLGDIAMCAPVIEAESQQNHINLKEHWAHMYLHSCLHLLGFDHNNSETAKNMEMLETLIMEQLKFYQPRSQQTTSKNQL